MRTETQLFGIDTLLRLSLFFPSSLLPSLDLCVCACVCACVCVRVCMCVVLVCSRCSMIQNYLRNWASFASVIEHKLHGQIFAVTTQVSAQLARHTSDLNVLSGGCHCRIVGKGAGPPVPCDFGLEHAACVALQCTNVVDPISP